MEKNLILRKDGQWYVLPCGEDMLGTLLAVTGHEEEDFDREHDDVFAFLASRGWEVEFVRAFSACA